jgi:outer membrane protein OmpA-like peptidoglycan-associated protein
MKYIYTLLCCILATGTMTAQQKNTPVIDSLFSINKAELSTDNTEFSAVLTNDNLIYYTSAKSNLKAENKNDTDLNIYQAVLNSDNSITDIKALEGINTKWHDGPVTITTDGNTMYFSSESFNVKKGFEKEKTPTKIYKKGKIYLFKATKTDGEWANATPLPFNNISYSVRNPSVSADGKTLYFSSDMPGSLGGEDVWKVSVNGNSYGTPENLGVNINSSSNESFPFITSKNVLYYSSDDDKGFGGMDVYKLDLNSENAEVINIGAPVNSDKDDFSFTLNEDKKTGFVSSNRDDSDDIYLINSICRLITSITVTNKETGANISNAKLDILKDKKTYQNFTTTEAPILSNLECETAYSLSATKEGYEDGSQTIEASVEGGELAINIELTPIKTPIITETQVVLQPIYFEYDMSNITTQGATELDKLVTVMKDNPEMIILVKSHTDSRGTDDYNKDLSNRRAQATVAYVVSKGISEARIFGKGFGESDLKINCTSCTEDENSQNRRSEFMIVR